MILGKWTGLAAAVVLSAATSAWASDKDDAKGLVRTGLAQFDKRDYGSAAESFAHAYALDPAPATLLDLALAELNADKPAQAAARFRAYLASVGEPPAKLEAVRSKYLPRAEEKLARVQLVVPAGAEVLVDGQSATQDPSLGVFEVVAGDHDVEVRAAGRSEKTHVTAPAGATLVLRALVDEPPPPAPVPSLPPEPPPEGDRGPSVARIATVAALGVGALAGLGIGIGFDAAAQNKASAISSGEGCAASMPASVACQHVTYDVSVEHQDEWTSIGGYIGAGVRAAAGVATWLLWPKSTVHVSAAIDGREVGLVVQGRLP